MFTIIAFLTGSQPLEIFGSQMCSSNSITWFHEACFVIIIPLPISGFKTAWISQRYVTTRKASSLKILRCWSQANYLIHVWVIFEKTMCFSQSVFCSLNKLSASIIISKIVSRVTRCSTNFFLVCLDVGHSMELT